MDLRKHVSVLLSFSKKERRGIYLLLSICTLLWVLPFFFSSEKIPEDVLSITPLEISEAKHVLQVRRDSVKVRWNSTSVYDYQRYAGDKNKKQEHRKETFAQRMRGPLDINSADSAALEKLPGIGEKLSARIIKYRERLGGFISISQLNEVYGLSDSVMQIISPMLFVSDQFKPSRIDVNKAEYKDLRKHPYFTHTIVKSLLAYRKAHGLFSSIEQVEKIISIERDEIRKIAPYLSFSD